MQTQTQSVSPALTLTKDLTAYLTEQPALSPAVPALSPAVPALSPAVPAQNRAAHHPETLPPLHPLHPRQVTVVETLTEDPVDDVPEPRRGSRADSGPTSDLFRQYLREIGRIPLLTAAEEVELARRVEAGLFAEEKLGTATDLDSRLALDLDRLVVMGRMAKQPS